MAKSFINIGGETRDASSLTTPATGRKFRDAWQFNGDVIEVDMAKARDLKIEKIIATAQERLAKAEAKAMKKALKGQGTAEEDVEIAKFKGKPKLNKIAMINSATTPEELDAITEDEIWT